MSIPRVSIGIPVYNGANFLREAIDALLAQSFTDFEILISDNASTDCTEQICRDYALRDSRIHYCRNRENLGAAKNYNLLVDKAQGEYFKWAAHDDLISPDFLEKCVAVLDNRPDAVLCYARSMIIDEHGNRIRLLPAIPQADEPNVARRFFSVVCLPRPQNSVFGVIRTDILRKTRLIGAFSSSDRVLNGELILRGTFVELPEPLFFKRNHTQAHWKVHSKRKDRQAWYDPNSADTRTYPDWRLLKEHLISIKTSPLTRTEQLACRSMMIWWVRRNWRALLGNLY